MQLSVYTNEFGCACIYIVAVVVVLCCVVIPWQYMVPRVQLDRKAKCGSPTRLTITYSTHSHSHSHSHRPIPYIQTTLGEPRVEKAVINAAVAEGRHILRITLLRWRAMPDGCGSPARLTGAMHDEW